MSEIANEIREVLSHLNGNCGSAYGAAHSGKIADLLERALPLVEAGETDK